MKANSFLHNYFHQTPLHFKFRLEEFTTIPRSRYPIIHPMQKGRRENVEKGRRENGRGEGRGWSQGTHSSIRMKKRTGRKRRERIKVKLREYGNARRRRRTTTKNKSCKPSEQNTTLTYRPSGDVNPSDHPPLPRLQANRYPQCNNR
eukprot:TRINITY_DN1995_c0_g1_i2.p1 TRINITY_DN1995_c0_g1~~TRINITY_DN1995_c0_g1_i2.p1  ORF type:complete len:147 (-),score=8.09 TRINITY_DN1995_c0_g1_i2:256-696(-)